MDMVDYLDQGDVWISREGVPQPIVEMDRSWRLNASRWLVRNAALVWQAYREDSLRQDLERHAEYAWRLTKTTTELVATLAAISKPDEWVKDTELFKALVEDEDPFEPTPALPPLRLVR